MDGKVSSKKRLIALQLLTLLLPPLNRHLFKKLIELLYLVSRKTVNLMTAKNLAVVFAPNIAAKTVSTKQYIVCSSLKTCQRLCFLSFYYSICFNLDRFPPLFIKSLHVSLHDFEDI